MGQPQGVILTHANIVSNIQTCQELFPLSRNDVGLSLLPLCHIFERMLDFLCFWKGVSIAYAESLEALPLNLREVRPTLMAVVPRVLEKIHATFVAMLGADSASATSTTRPASQAVHRLRRIMTSTPPQCLCGSCPDRTARLDTPGAPLVGSI
jgi:long-subunit acyl-CoA synthetase (AMP-forming)